MIFAALLKVKDNQKRRFKSLEVVETVDAQDTLWRKLRFKVDNWNKLKNLCSKQIGERMKKKEALGDENEGLPDGFKNQLEGLTADSLKPFTVNQIKKVRVLIDEAIAQDEKDMLEAEKKRNQALFEVGNHLHESVPVDDNEDNNKVERTFGDTQMNKKYSHVDLIHMIDGKKYNIKNLTSFFYKFIC